MKARLSTDSEPRDRTLAVADPPPTIPGPPERRASRLRRRRALPLLEGALLVATALAGACDQTFEPLAKNDIADFSVFGYLDASADTQWIRVMPVRSLKWTSPDSFGDRVTLEEQGTGRMITLHDSLFTFNDNRPSPVAGSMWVHNFWTSQPIEPGARYTLSIQGDSGQVATADIAIPPAYHVELSIAQRGGFNLSGQLHISGVKHLPFVAQLIWFRDGCSIGVDTDTVWYAGGPSEDGSYTVLVRKDSLKPRGDGFCGSPRVLARDLWLVGSDSLWPSGVSYAPGALGAASLSTNVENAIGFVGGVLTRLFPYGDCTFKTTSLNPPEYCTLNYDLSSASLEGTVSETRCGRGPLDNATVTLTQLDADPAEVRTFLTAPDGHYWIAALEPGTRYALEVSRGKGSVVIGPVYSMVEDTLTFTSGERRERDFGLHWLPSCELLMSSSLSRPSDLGLGASRGR